MAFSTEQLAYLESLGVFDDPRESESSEDGMLLSKDYNLCNRAQIRAFQWTHGFSPVPAAMGCIHVAGEGARNLQLTFDVAAQIMIAFQELVTAFALRIAESDSSDILNDPEVVIKQSSLSVFPTSMSRFTFIDFIPTYAQLDEDGKPIDAEKPLILNAAFTGLFRLLNKIDGALNARESVHALLGLQDPLLVSPLTAFLEVVKETRCNLHLAWDRGENSQIFASATVEMAESVTTNGKGNTLMGDWKYVSGDTLISSPGEILKEEFLEPLSISQYRLAKTIHVSESAISEIINGKRAITLDMAIRLAKALGTTPEYWMNLQATYSMKTVDWAKYKDIQSLVDKNSLSTA